MNRHHSKLLLLLVFVLSLAVIFIFVGGRATASASLMDAGSLSETSTDSASTSCRYGTSGSPYNSFLQEIGVGWVHDFGARSYSNLPDNLQYVPTVRMKQVKDAQGNRLPQYELYSPPTMGALASLVAANPGRLWLVGNEVDRVYMQDDMMPQIYAQAYHDIYHLIKANDPAAQVAPSGLVQVTPGRLQYLDIVWDTYLSRYGTTMPVDVWNMHVYILPERQMNGNHSRAAIALGTDPSLAIYDSGDDAQYCSRDDVYCIAEHDDIDIFKEQVVAMRRWMKDHGQQKKPLILTEFSILYPFREPTDPEYDPENCPTCYTQYDEYGEPFDPERVTIYMNKTLDYLERTADPNLGYPEDNYRLVQQWNWFSLTDSDHPAASSSLLEDDLNGLTMMGRNYRDWIARKDLEVNLRLDTVHAAVVNTTGGTATAPLSVTFRNNGDTLIQSSFKVTFYSNATLTQEIGSVVVTEDVLGCATYPYTVGVEWANLGPGVHRFWVKVDSEPIILETQENDNQGSGIVLVDPEQVFLPALSN